VRCLGRGLCLFGRGKSGGNCTCIVLGALERDPFDCSRSGRDCGRPRLGLREAQVLALSPLVAVALPPLILMAMSPLFVVALPPLALRALPFILARPPGAVER